MSEPPPSPPRRPFLHTRDIDVARAGFRAFYGEDTLLHGGDPARFEWRARFARLGPLAVVADLVHCAAGATGTPESYVIVSTRAGGGRMATGDCEVDLVPGRSASLVTATTGASLQLGAEVQTADLILDRRFVEAQLEALTGVAPRQRIRFAPRVGADTGVGASVLRLAGAIVDELEAGAEIFGHPLVAAGIGESLVRAILLGHPHDHDHLLGRPAPPTSRRTVRLAEEYLDARAAEPVLLSDLASSLGVSVRSLDAAFRSQRGTTAEAFLRRRRLQLARARLLSAAPGATVNSIALALGFFHPGAFAAAYARAFGERPEQTLRRGLVLLEEAPSSEALRLPGPSMLASLSLRQREVCERAAQGMLQKQMAAELGISKTMVQHHLALGMKRLGVRSTAELARLWERLGAAGG